MPPSFFKKLGPISIDLIKSSIRCELVNISNNISYENLVGIYTGLNHKFPLRKYPDNVVQVLEIIVKCTIISGELTCSSESLQLEFYPEHFPPDPLFPGNEVFLNDFLNNKIGVL